MRGRAVKTILGTILLVQEGRFQLRDEQGAAHLFILGHASFVETDQLPALARSQSRVRVSYKEAENIVGLIAERIDVFDMPRAA